MSDIKGHKFYDSIYMKYPEQVNPQKENADWWLPEIWERGEWGVTA